MIKHAYHLTENDWSMLAGTDLAVQMIKNSLIIREESSSHLALDVKDWLDINAQDLWFSANSGMNTIKFYFCNPIDKENVHNIYQNFLAGKLKLIK